MDNDDDNIRPADLDMDIDIDNDDIRPADVDISR